MQLKLFILAFLAFIFIQLPAQNSTDTTIGIKPDSFKTSIKITDGKIVTIGEPVYAKPLTTTEKIKIFFKTAYEKYTLWCWIAGIFLLLSLLRLSRRFFK